MVMRKVILSLVLCFSCGLNGYSTTDDPGCFGCFKWMFKRGVPVTPVEAEGLHSTSFMSQYQVRSHLEQLKDLSHSHLQEFKGYWHQAVTDDLDAVMMVLSQLSDGEVKAIIKWANVNDSKEISIKNQRYLKLFHECASLNKGHLDFIYDLHPSKNTGHHDLDDFFKTHNWLFPQQ